MNNNQFDKELMDYLDGISEDAVNNKDLQDEAKDLKQILSDLKSLPLEMVDPTVDKKLKVFIEKQSNIKQPIVRKLWPYVVAASIILLVFMLSRSESFEIEYQKLSTNPERLSFIYNLNSENLNEKDIDWLKRELQNDISPNIKVTIVDLLADYQSEIDQDFYNLLQFESIPSVQMALLNMLESSAHIDITEQIIALRNRQDLDIMVQQKANEILSIQ